VNLLREIAARATPLSEIDYIELQVEGEKFRAQPGWQARVDFLNEIRERAMIMKAIAEGKDATTWLPARVPSGAHSESQGFLKRLYAKLRGK
jgi:hypothetical protein